MEDIRFFESYNGERKRMESPEVTPGLPFSKEDFMNLKVDDILSVDIMGAHLIFKILETFSEKYNSLKIKCLIFGQEMYTTYNEVYGTSAQVVASMGEIQERNPKGVQLNSNVVNAQVSESDVTTYIAYNCPNLRNINFDFPMNEFQCGAYLFHACPNLEQLTFTDGTMKVKEVDSFPYMYKVLEVVGDVSGDGYHVLQDFTSNEVYKYITDTVSGGLIIPL